MAQKQKQAKMANRQKGGAEVSTRRMYTVAGSPLTGYYVLDPQGAPLDPPEEFENMWDAIERRKELDAG